MPVGELREHLHTLPDRPTSVPYRTSYYDDSWGFCLAHDDLAGLPDDEVDVRIDATLEDGSLTYGECLIPGRSERRGAPVHATCATRRWPTTTCRAWRSWHSWGGRCASAPSRSPTGSCSSPAPSARSSGCPATRRASAASTTGSCVTGLGDPGGLTYKRSRRGDADDRPRRRARAADGGGAHTSSTSRPTATTSASSAHPASTSRSGGSAAPRTASTPSTTPRPTTSRSCSRSSSPTPSPRVTEIVDVLEGNDTYLNLSPKGEPQLGRRGLYRARRRRRWTSAPPRCRCCGCSTSRTAGTTSCPSPSVPSCPSARSGRRPTDSSSTTCSRPLPARA